MLLGVELGIDDGSLLGIELGLDDGILLGVDDGIGISLGFALG